MAGEYTPACSPSATPLRSSPLSRPPVCASGRLGSPSRRLSESSYNHHPRARPIQSSNRHVSQPTSSLHNSHRSTTFTAQSPPLSPSTPSRSDTPVAGTCPSPPLSRSQPLLGSYQLSLLHSRMSRTQSHSLHSTSQKGFSLHIGAVGKGKHCETTLRCPPPLDIPFSATYYDLPAGSTSGAISHSPWVGHIDLEGRYFDEYAHLSTPGAGPSRPRSPPAFPGMNVAAIGQLQLLVKSADAPIKVFIVPYDLRRVPLGGRLLVRERQLVRSPESSGERGVLRYAIQLQFTCLPIVPPSSSGSSTTRRPRTLAMSLPVDPQIPLSNDDRAYYLSKSIKVIFSAQPLGSSDQLILDRHDEVVFPHTPLQQSDKSRVVPSPASLGRQEEWEMVRQKWLARRQMIDSSSDAIPIVNSIPDSPPIFEKSPIVPRSQLPHIPLLASIPSIAPSRDPSRPPTPTIKESPSRSTSPAMSGAPLSHTRGTSSQRYARRQRARLGSGSYEDKELSEKLRALEVSDR